MKIYNEIYKKQRAKKRIEMLKKLAVWLVRIIFIMLLSFSTVYLFGQEIRFLGNSMSPVIESGDRVLLNKASGILFAPGVGDLVAFRPNGNPLADIEIKRVVAVPSETVKIENGALYINGKKFSRELPTINEAGIAGNEIKLSAGEYFVLSDNVDSMQDSRNAEIGIVKRSYCVGNAWFIIAPSDRRGLLR